MLMKAVMCGNLYKKVSETLYNYNAADARLVDFPNIGEGCRYVGQACRGYEISHPYPYPYPHNFTWISMDISISTDTYPVYM